MTGIVRLRRVTDLFIKGRCLHLGDDEAGEPILIWVMKLNMFEKGEAQRDAQFGAVKRRFALAPDSSEMQLALQGAKGKPKKDVVEDLLVARESELFLSGRDDIHADEEWKDRLALIERNGLLEEGSTLSEEEREAVEKAEVDYTTAVMAAIRERTDAARDELLQEDDDALIEQYLDRYRDSRSTAAYMEERDMTEIFFALRDCHAIRDGDRWNHVRCVHARLLKDRKEVRDLPDDILQQVRGTLAEMEMSEAEAGNSDAPSTSSESSERPNTPEESTPSTPTAAL